MKYILAILVIFFASNAYSFKPSATRVKPTNDTTEVIKICLTKAFDSLKLPGLGAAKRKYKFGDSILLTAKNVLFKYLPAEVNASKFKILRPEKICSMLVAETNIEQRPNYIIIQFLEKKGNVYNVIIESLSCGKFPSGGGLGITVRKENDILKITEVSGFSIN